MVHLGEWRTWGRKRQPGHCPSVSGRTIQSIDSVPKSGYKQDNYPKMRTVNYGRTALRMAECLTFALAYYYNAAAQNSVSGQVQRSRRMRLKQLSWQHPAETDHPCSPK